MKVKEESKKAGLKLNIQKIKIVASGPITLWQRWKTMETVGDFILGGSKITAVGDCSHEIKRCWLLGRKAITNLESESEVVQSCPTLYDPMNYSLPGSSVHEIFQARVLGWVAISFSRKTPENPLDCKEIKLVNPIGDQSWIFIGRADDEAEAPMFWLPDAKKWLIEKDPDARKYWRQEDNQMTKDVVVGWSHWFNGHEFEQTLGVGDGQGSLACYNTWGCKVHGHGWVTELNWVVFVSWILIDSGIDKIFVTDVHHACLFFLHFWHQIWTCYFFCSMQRE